MTFHYQEDTVMGELERIKAMLNKIYKIMEIAKDDI